MINFADIREALGDYFESEIPNLLSLRRDDNPPFQREGAGVDPNVNPYLTFKNITMVTIGEDSVLSPDVNGHSEMLGDREFTLRVDYFGNEAISNIDHLYSSTFKIDVVENFRAVNLVIVDMLNNVDTTGVVNNNNEERATSDWLCRASSVIVDEGVGLIENVNINGTLKIADIVNRNLQITINE
jgi:hypothetical protein